ncbi:glucitol operon activator protein [Escherichia coli]|uniref:Glucitol operon activator protein n=1 Tax=Escherichia coli TaxID=562 RepID=A0A447X2P6_ECOLX|nr:glucitol operon activator protein [Escherichia coli]
MVSALITVAVIAWCAQLALGGWQISRFNRAFDTYASKGGLAWAVPAGALNRGSWSPSPWTISNASSTPCL